MRVSVLLVLLLLGNSTFAQSGISLLDNSPFMPPGKANTGVGSEEQGPASLAKLQLRGITSINGEYIFSVYNPDTRESKWIAQGIEEDGLIIESFDIDDNSVVIHSESENLSRQMEMNDYAAPTGLRAPPERPAVTSVRPQPAVQQAPGVPAVSSGNSLVRTQEAIQRPTLRNLETLRARRAELADKLRKQPQPTNSNNNGSTQSNGGNR